MSKLPESIVAIDVETTGLNASDRIVTLGAWRVNTADLETDAIRVQCLHLIVDPGKKSHPKAEEVHGYSDWVLRHQQPFSDYADTIREFLLNGAVVVAHNASFDLEFIDREYRVLGNQTPYLQHYCTMDGFQRLGFQGSLSLNSACRQIGLRRSGKRHGALEDARLSLMVYFWLHTPP